jgi:AAA-ATPase Vps4-associated protein 1
VSKEEIARIKAEWEAKESRKKEKDKDKDSKDKSGGRDEEESGGGGGKKGAKSSSPSGTTSPTAAGSGSGAATPTHKRYSLHRDFLAMRQAEHRRKRQTKQMQELAPRLPGAPHGSLMG